MNLNDFEFSDCFFIHLSRALTEFEREMISERKPSRLKAASARGGIGGKLTGIRNETLGKE